MKRIIVLSFSLFLIFSCTDVNNSYPKAENSMDAGREFINACLTGDFKKAQFYMLKDSDNLHRLSVLEKEFPAKNKVQNQKTSLIILDEENKNDSTDIIHYKTSSDTTARKLVVVLINNDWQVDYKQSFIK